MTTQELIDNVQKEMNAGSDVKVKAADWLRFVLDGITEAFLTDGSLRIRSLPPASSVYPVPYTIDPDADPSSYEIPASLQPFRVGLEAYIKFRYFSLNPKNTEESAAASKAYQQFLACFGVQGSAKA